VLLSSLDCFLSMTNKSLDSLSAVRAYIEGVFLFGMLQGLLISCQCRWTDAACAVPSRCSDWARDSPPCTPDQHAESRRGGVRSYHQQPNKVCLYRWQGLRQSLGHQPAWLKESCLPVRLPGEFLTDSPTLLSCT
jgi:hypothetical protein